MATGKTGYFDIAGTGGFAGRVNWSETYDIESNTSVVAVSLSIQSKTYGGRWYPGGTISVDGIPVVTMDFNNKATHTFNVYSAGDVWHTIYPLYGNADQPWNSGAIVHDDNGKKNVTISVNLKLYRDGNTAKPTISGSSAIALTEIPRASALAVSDGTLNTPQTIKVERKSTSFSHTITYECGTAKGTICTKSTDDSINFTPPLSLASQNTNGATVAVTFTLQTYSGSTAVGNPVSKTVTMAIPESVKPYCAVAVSDYMGYESRYGAYVKGLSRLSVNVVSETAYGAEIVSHQVTANGVVYKEAEFVTDALKTAGNMTISAKVTDSRNRTSAEAKQTISVLDYTAPAISNLTAVRCSADGTANSQGGYVKVTFSAAVTALNNQNSAEYFLHYKKPAAVDWEGVAFDELYGDYTVTNHSYVFPADTGSSYNVQITVEDNHFGMVRNVNAPTAFALMHPNPDGTGIALGKICEKSNAVEFGLPLYDKFGTSLGNGLAVYGGGNEQIDANTTLEHLILTTKNAPTSSFHYIYTCFYTSKGTTNNRAQFALPYNATGCMYYRFYSGGVWSDWTGCIANGVQVSGSLDLKATSSIRMYGAGATNAVAFLSDRIRSTANDTHYLGDSTYKFKAVYAVSGAIQTSDRNQKKDIEDIDQRYIDLFDKLRPVSFAFSDPESDRIHIGFISQDVKAAMDEVGLSDLDFAGFCRDVLTEWDEETQTDKAVTDEDGNPVYLYSLRYSEFIALNSKMIQINRKKIAEQQQELNAMKAEVEELKRIVQGLVAQA